MIDFWRIKRKRWEVDSVGISDLFYKLADTAKNLEKMDFGKIGDELRKSSNIKFQKYSEYFKCDKSIFFQKNLIILTDNLDVKFVGSSDKFSVSVFLQENINVELVSVLFSEIDKNTIKITGSCHQNNCQGFLLIKGFSGQCLSVKSKHGDVNLVNTEIESVKIELKNGDIDVSDLRFVNVELVTDNGDIDIVVNQDCKLDIDSQNGDVSKSGVKSNSRSVNVLKCRSKNGDITVQKA